MPAHSTVTLMTEGAVKNAGPHCRKEMGRTSWGKKERGKRSQQRHVECWLWKDARKPSPTKTSLESFSFTKRKFRQSNIRREPPLAHFTHHCVPLVDDLEGVSLDSVNSGIRGVSRVRGRSLGNRNVRLARRRYLLTPKGQNLKELKQKTKFRSL